MGDKYQDVLLALDLFKEEEKFRGTGPGESLVIDYDGLGAENYTSDRDWMPNVVMIAKNAYVWLDQLSRKYQKDINKLDQIPDEELDLLSGWGFSALWLIGLWERSKASKTIKQWCGNPEAVASAYSLYDYIIAGDLGGYEAYKNLQERAWRRGIRSTQSGGGPERRAPSVRPVEGAGGSRGPRGIPRAHRRLPARSHYRPGGPHGPIHLLARSHPPRR